MVALVVSCNKSTPNDPGGNQAAPVEQSQDSQLPHKDRKAIFGEEGATIDGTKWTLSDLSDAFDESLTIEKAKETFGARPLIKEHKGNVMFTYIIETNDVYVRGVRITSLDLLFVDGVFENARFGFTTYAE